MRIMERDVADNEGVVLNDSDEKPRSAVNSVVLDYYKKFGRKRDLEQYFSLSTAQSDIRDPRSLFWRRMKEQSDNSDSGEKRSESSNEICRISIKCSIPEKSTSQSMESNVKSDSESPPIITDPLPGPSANSGDESVDDDHSQKSMDGTLDTSVNKPLSPTSSVTSQRKLEWDSLADVGYGNESDRKTSASSLSTLEREVLAQKQQYTLDFKQTCDIDPPTAQSTPIESNENKTKAKKGIGKKTTFCKKDIDVVEVCVPQNADMNTQAINVNLTKRFSVNLDRDGGIKVDSFQKDVSVSPEKKAVAAEVSPQVKMDKEIQTSLARSKGKSPDADSEVKAIPMIHSVPVLINLNTLRKRHRIKKFRTLRKKRKSKKISSQGKEDKKEKSAEQVSEAESFEYMPGHMYNQNQLNDNQNRPSNNNIAGNKSSLESSAAHTTDSSKGSKYSFRQELEKSLDVLKSALKDRYDDNLKKKLIKEIIQRLVKNKYHDDSTPDFPSVLSLISKKSGVSNYVTTSTSDAENTLDKATSVKPKKSILRGDRFNSNPIASTSQSAPNLPLVSNSEKPVGSYLKKQISSSVTDTDASGNISGKDNTSSDTAFAKTSSEELYKKYIDALKREEAYKQHLRDKELFLKQKLVSSETALKVPVQLDSKTNNRLKDLIKDLTRNNYDDGSGDASKLEGGSNSNLNYEINRNLRNQRSHSVFTLSSGNSDVPNRKANCRNKTQNENRVSPRAGTSQQVRCVPNCKCPASNRIAMADSSVQVNINPDINSGKKIKKKLFNMSDTDNVDAPKAIACIPDPIPEDVKYVCLCTEKALAAQNDTEQLLIYKCSRLSKQKPVINMTSKASNTVNAPCVSKCTSPRMYDLQLTSPRENREYTLKETSGSDDVPMLRTRTKSSQTRVDLALNVFQQPYSARSVPSITSEDDHIREILPIKHSYSTTDFKAQSSKNGDYKMINEATRCLQTEISIDPKISDPTLSDINIINSAECVKLIGELYRKVSRRSSEPASYQRQSDNASTNTYSKSSKNYIYNRDKEDADDFSLDENENKPLTDLPSVEGQETVKPCLNCKPVETRRNVLDSNITIPIQGTNMTLKVCIDSNAQRDHYINNNPNPVTQGIATNKVAIFDKGTSIREECSKAVQSQEPYKETIKEMAPGNYDKVDSIRKLEDKYNTYPKMTYENNNKTSTSRSDPEKSRCACRKPKSPPEISAKESKLQLDEPLISHDKKSNTFPKQIDEKKPFLRTNTDPSDLIESYSVQTDHIEKQDQNTQQDTPARSVSIDEKSKTSSKQNSSSSKRNSRNQSNYSTSTDRSCTGKSKSSSQESSNSFRSSKKHASDSAEQSEIKNAKKLYNQAPGAGTSKDLILDMIQDITQRYTKKDHDKSMKKKCFKEIVTVLNYLLDTDDSGDAEPINDLRESKAEPKLLRTRSSEPSINVNEVTKTKSRRDEIISDSKATVLDNKKPTRDACCGSSESANVDTCNIPKVFRSQNDAVKKTRDTGCGCEDSSEDKDTSEPSWGARSKALRSGGSRKNSAGHEAKTLVDKGVQSPVNKVKSKYIREESSDIHVSTSASTESPTSRILNKIKKECEKYQRRVKCHCTGKRHEMSSSTSADCDHCKRNHHCQCKGYKNKVHRSKSCTDKIKKKFVAYNLILQTSESMISEEQVCNDRRPLQNIVVKVPKRRHENVPFKEISAKIEQNLPDCSPRCNPRNIRSRSWPNDSALSSTDDVKMARACTVRDYLEKNRPDFVERSSYRQNCIRLINESRANERTKHRELLSMQLESLPTLTEEEVRCLAKELGFRQKKIQPKIISEREMKKHSEKIYKSLPEVVRKKEDAKKEGIKKTNLLMASLFKKNLQRKTLRGSVNISNYSTVIKI